MLEVPTSSTRRLDAIWLPQGVQWMEEYQNVPLSFESEFTTGGTGVIWQQKLTGLETITLNFDQGWLNKEMVDNLSALANQKGANYILQWDGKNRNVVFIPTNFRLTFLEGFRQTENIEDCPFVGEFQLTTIN